MPKLLPELLSKIEDLKKLDPAQIIQDLKSTLKEKQDILLPLANIIKEKSYKIRELLIKSGLDITPVEHLLSEEAQRKAFLKHPNRLIKQLGDFSLNLSQEVLSQSTIFKDLLVLKGKLHKFVKEQKKCLGIISFYCIKYIMVTGSELQRNSKNHYIALATQNKLILKKSSVHIGLSEFKVNLILFAAQHGLLSTINLFLDNYLLDQFIMNFNYQGDFFKLLNKIFITYKVNNSLYLNITIERLLQDNIYIRKPLLVVNLFNQEYQDLQFYINVICGKFNNPILIKKLHELKSKILLNFNKELNRLGEYYRLQFFELISETENSAAIFKTLYDAFAAKYKQDCEEVQQDLLNKDTKHLYLQLKNTYENYRSSLNELPPAPIVLVPYVPIVLLPAPTVLGSNVMRSSTTTICQSASDEAFSESPASSSSALVFRAGTTSDTSNSEIKRFTNPPAAFRLVSRKGALDKF